MGTKEFPSLDTVRQRIVFIAVFLLLFCGFVTFVYWHNEWSKKQRWDAHKKAEKAREYYQQYASPM